MISKLTHPCVSGSLDLTFRTSVLCEVETKAGSLLGDKEMAADPREIICCTLNQEDYVEWSMLYTPKLWHLCWHLILYVLSFCCHIPNRPASGLDKEGS